MPTPAIPFFGSRKAPWILGSMACAIVLVAGLASDVSLGDENHHVGFARAMAERGHRLVYNPLFPSADPPGYPYVTDILWPGLLAAIWAALGRTDFWIAQLYHTGWFALLLAGTYFTARQLLGRIGATWSLVLLCSIPVIVLYSVTMYTDMPAAALLTTSAALALTGWGLPAGVVFGLAYLTKKSALFLLPMLGLLLFRGCRRPRWPSDEAADPALPGPEAAEPPQPAPRTSANVPRWLLMYGLQGALFLGAAAGIYWPERQWMRAHIPVQKTAVSGDYIKQRMTVLWSSEKLPSSMADPVDLLTHLGPLLIGVFLWYLLARRWRQTHGWIWAGVAVGFVATVFMFTLNTDIRYALPIVVMLAIPLAGALARVRTRWVALLLAVLCAGQFVGAAAFTAMTRRLPAETRLAYANLREAIPPGSRVLHLEEAFMLHTRRPIVWVHLVDPDTGLSDITQLMRPKPPEGQTPERHIMKLLWHNGVDYILVKRERIVSDRTIGLGGFPRAFVERIEQMPHIRAVQGDWPGFSLYRVLPEESVSGKTTPHKTAITL